MQDVQEIYFDWAAAAPPDNEILDFYRQTLERCFVNQEAGYRAAFLLRKELHQAGENIAECAGLGAYHTIFGASGTELAQALALLPLAPGGNVVCSALEHPALAAAAQNMGREVRLLVPDSTGRIAPEALDATVDEQTRIVFCHFVQSELGVVQDIDALVQCVRGQAPRAVFCCDAIQGAGKLPLPQKADILLLSGHKFGAPGGAALLHAPELRLDTFWHEMRSVHYRLGRPEPALCLALAETFRRRTERLQLHLQQATDFNQALRTALAEFPLRFSVEAAASSPYILHCTLPGYQGAILSRMLGERNIAVAAGSACQAESQGPSPALLALGFRRETAYAGLRMSFGFAPDLREIPFFVDVLRNVLNTY